MDFLLRIYFAGLIAFAPLGEGREMMVLLVDARDGYAASDGTWIEEHRPLLLARAGQCRGTCREQDEGITELLYPDALRKGSDEAAKALGAALRGGGGWVLGDSNLSIVAPPGAMPTGGSLVRASSATRESFDWVASIEAIDPSAATIDADVLKEHPTKGLIAARLKLSAGLLKTYRLVRADDQLAALSFRALRDRSSRVASGQPLTDWVMLEIPVSGCRLELLDENFSTGARRTMELSPSKCDGSEVVELALLNVPKARSHSASEKHAGERRIGHHFEIYYELSSQRPPNRLRPVPVLTSMVPEPQARLLGDDKAVSDFVAAIVPEDPKGITAPPICPVVRFSGFPVGAETTPASKDLVR